MILNYKYRLKNSCDYQSLRYFAGTVNFVWNYCNEASYRSITHNNKWLSQYDLQNLTSGCSKELRIHSQTIQAVCLYFALRRRQFRKLKLSWRTAKRSLAWIPFNGQSIRVINDVVYYNKKRFRFWKSRSINGTIKAGSFSQDARGRWYVIFSVDVIDVDKVKSNKAVGVDFGLKTTATLSTGEKFEGGKHYRRLESKLSMAQRANKKRLRKSISAKIANCRRDELHKFSTQLVNQYDTIFVGDVSSLKLVKTPMAKSVLDAGWGMFRSMLEYKAIRLGVDVIETKENFSSVTCSACGERSGPSGLSDLGVREWTCMHCNISHDRDINAAHNILRFGRESLKGALLLGMRQDSAPDSAPAVPLIRE